ncbi:hypothetical protein Mp_2g22280 [Marchantia polymorpha subsp. ruderalis]|uniref:Uncharacterized protein n=1 Tax=Marchantia polymorpha TaxID=3197 RepID=A0A2R6WNE4_MARPO|nr:hypothetical protein MARPO_0072s0099 [Marchantia polymorpha]BBN03282.1 hypothetical protein Mp_2g22280 [Marchantia polymorpha subsp. ruderalis]|eukprot:PTQ35366.1 hypothetical protein MARPO_0072s0099 [Marchantia polymorpha]
MIEHQMLYVQSCARCLTVVVPTVHSCRSLSYGKERCQTLLHSSRVSFRAYSLTSCV